jgi:hypothetical protein
MKKLLLLCLCLLGSSVFGQTNNYTPAPGSGASAYACIVNTDGSPAPGGLKVTWTAGHATQGSGFHYHEYTEVIRPQKITIYVTTSYTGSNGCTHTPVSFPWYAGWYPLTACSTATVNGCSSHMYQVIATGAPFTPMSNGTGFTFWPDPIHNNMSTALDSYSAFALRSIGSKYYSTTGGLSFQVSRASLPWGGYNDDNTAHFADTNFDPHTYGHNFDVMKPASASGTTILQGIIDGTPDIFGGYCKRVDYVTFWDVNCE